MASHQQIVEAFEKHPMMAATLRRTVYVNGYRPGVDLDIDCRWEMRAADKSVMVDAMRALGLVTRDWKLTEDGYTLACRLTS